MTSASFLSPKSFLMATSRALNLALLMLVIFAGLPPSIAEERDELAPSHAVTFPSKSVDRTFSLPQGARRVLWLDLNRSEWRVLLPRRPIPPIGGVQDGAPAPRPMSERGHERRFRDVRGTSALPPILTVDSGHPGKQLGATR